MKFGSSYQVMKDSTDERPLPYVGAGDATASVDLSRSGANVVLFASWNRSSFTGRVKVLYRKLI
jgi:opacity protein-like surface antigen